jgi:hypothetical protein
MSDYESMSDYLWDKTGDADADVERLEELLGEFRHRRRALELPTEVSAHASEMTNAQTNASRARRLFGGSRLSRPAWAAVAAALLVILAAVAFVALRSRVDDKQSASRDSQPQTPKDAKQQSATPQVANSPSDESAPHVIQQPRAVQEERRDEQAVIESPRGSERPRAGANTRRKGEEAYVQTPKEREKVFVTPSFNATGARAPLTPEEQRRAKEQLVYALRLTSLKLKEVQRRTQSAVDLKPAFDERDHPR